MLMVVGARSLLALPYPIVLVERICRLLGSRLRNSRRPWVHIADLSVSLAMSVCILEELFAYCWEVAKCEDGEKTGLSASTVSYDDKLSTTCSQYLPLLRILRGFVRPYLRITC